MATVLPASASSAGLLVLATGGLRLTTTRLMLAPAGSRLPRGAHALVAVPLLPTSADGSGRRAMRVVAGAAGADEAEPAGNTASSDESFFYMFLEAQGQGALCLMSETTPPDRSREEYLETKKKLTAALVLARARKLDKRALAVDLVRVAYQILKFAYACYPVAPALPSLPEEEETFVGQCLAIGEGGSPSSPLIGEAPFLFAFDFGPEVDVADAGLMRAVMVAMTAATCASRTGRYIYAAGDGRGSGMVPPVPSLPPYF